MDSKKANLTPELKEIYDRVMNTTGTPKAPPQAAPGAQPDTLKPPPVPQTPSQGMPSLAETPTTPPPLPQQPPPVQPQFHGPQQPEPLPGAPTPAEEALSSAPARPVSGGGSFSYSGGNVKSNTPQTNAPAQGKKKSLVSKPILIVLGLVFIAVWGIFWAIIFGLIQR